MNQPNNCHYYASRAEVSRDLARRALNPAIAAIHAEFAVRYDRLAAHHEPKSERAVRTAQAA